ncbi:unnamed protein product [Aphanomyces euteiches]
MAARIQQKWKGFVRRKAFQLELQAYQRVKTFVGNASSGFAHSMDGARSGKIRVGGHFNPKTRSRTTMSTPTWSSNSPPNCQAVQYLCGWERCDLDSMARNVYGKDKWHVLVDASQARCARFRQRRINYVAALERLVALVATRQAKLAQFRELQHLLATTPPDQTIATSLIDGFPSKYAAPIVDKRKYENERAACRARQLQYVYDQKQVLTKLQARTLKCCVHGPNELCHEAKSSQSYHRRCD